MTFWDWIYRLGPGWPDQRGWYAAALFVQTCAILLLVALVPSLAQDEFFKSIATAIVVTGWVGFAVAGRDNRLDREQVGQAQELARRVLDHVQAGQTPPPRWCRMIWRTFSFATGSLWRRCWASWRWALHWPCMTVP
jgi:hypothetical protein